MYSLFWERETNKDRHTDRETKYRHGKRQTDIQTDRRASRASNEQPANNIWEWLFAWASGESGKMSLGIFLYFTFCTNVLRLSS